MQADNEKQTVATTSVLVYSIYHKGRASPNHIHAHLLLVCLELWCCCVLEGNSQRSNLVVVWASLQGWEDREVNLGLVVILAALWLTLGQALRLLGALRFSQAVRASGFSV